MNFIISSSRESETTRLVLADPLTPTETYVALTHSSRQPVRWAAHHTAAPVQITLRRALSTARIARLSLISRAAISERVEGCGNCGNFLSGEVRVPASRGTMLYDSGSSGGTFDLSVLAPSSVRAHLEMDRRRAYEMVSVGELACSERSGESSAESGVGTASTSGRNNSTRWGSSEIRRLSESGGGPLIGLMAQGSGQSFGRRKYLKSPPPSTGTLLQIVRETVGVQVRTTDTNPHHCLTRRRSLRCHIPAVQLANGFDYPFLILAAAPHVAYFLHS